MAVFNLPVAYALVKFGFPAYSVFIGSICLELLAGVLRVWFAHLIAGLDVKSYVVHTWFYSISSAVIAAALALLIKHFIHESFTSHYCWDDYYFFTGSAWQVPCSDYHGK